jgi:hypothetical protein
VGGRVIGSLCAAFKKEDIPVLEKYGIFFKPEKEEFESVPFGKFTFTMKKLG